MASRLHAAQNKQEELEAQRKALLADPEATVEQVDAHLAAIAANDREIASLKALQDAERTAPAVRLPATVEPQVDPAGGFANVAHFALDVMSACSPQGRRSERLDAYMRHETQAALFGAALPSNTHLEQGSSEGFPTPPALREQIWEVVTNDDFFTLFDMEPTNSYAVDLGADESTPWGASGVKAYFRSETEQMTPTKLVGQGRQVPLHECYAMVAATERLMEDAPRLNARLTTKSGQAISWRIGEVFMWGKGPGLPLGWMESPALVTVAKESGQTARTINVENVSNMYSRLYTGPGARPYWFANRDIVPQLITLKIGDIPVWTSFNSGIKEAPEGLLLGTPVRFTEHCETLGTLGDLQLVDLAGYYAAKRSAGPQFAESIHLWFDYGARAFRWLFRVGAEPFLTAPVSPARGSNTKSHFLALATRA